MAISPIDLQTLFSQVDKVGKTQAAERDGLAQQLANHGAKIERRTEEDIQSVNQAQNTGDGVEKTKDREAEKKDQGEGKKHRGGNQPEGEEDRPVIHDLTLGRNVDISF